MMVTDEHVCFRCRSCNKVYKSFDGLVRHKKHTKHLGIEVVETE